MYWGDQLPQPAVDLSGWHKLGNSRDASNTSMSLRPYRNGAESSPKSALERAKAEFLELRVRHNWSIEDVVAFFPEEEGICFLLKLLQEPPKKRGRKAKV